MSDKGNEKAFLTDLMLKSSQPQELFKPLFEYRKSQHKQFSIGYICRTCEIPSRGYVSEFLNGKRLLNERYWKPIIKCFGLNGRFADIAYLLFSMATEDAAQRQQLEKRLESLRRAIHNDTGTLPRKLQGLFFAFEVFCAFGLFKNQPTKEDLKKYFGRQYALEVEYALNALLALDLIGFEAEKGHYLIRENHIRFNDSEDDGLSHYNYLRYAVKDAEANIKKWYKHEDSLFESSIISVRRETYREFLQRYYEDLLVNMRDLDSKDADSIIRFNVQIYPIR